MANTFKLSSKAGVTSADVIYTVATSTTTIILGLILGNTTTSQVTATVTLTSVPSGLYRSARLISTLRPSGNI